jgi:crotonobetainyl-CoA:carnitine CoA-transferase CaiB-like acyl-CoA transferase
MLASVDPSKRSLALDLKKPDRADVFCKLISQAKAVVELMNARGPRRCGI